MLLDGLLSMPCEEASPPATLDKGAPWELPWTWSLGDEEPAAGPCDSGCRGGSGRGSPPGRDPPSQHHLGCSLGMMYPLVWQDPPI